MTIWKSGSPKLRSSTPTVTLEGDANGAPRPDATSYSKKFSAKYTHRLITGMGDVFEPGVYVLGPLQLVWSLRWNNRPEGPRELFDFGRRHTLPIIANAHL